MPVITQYPVLAIAPVALDTCDNIYDCRTLRDIIGGCLSTILLCTWVSLHLNVPPLRPRRLPEQHIVSQGFFAPLRKIICPIVHAIPLKKIEMMLLALIAPELMMGFAARQYIVARWFSTKYSGVSRTHGFFFAMGGFVTRDGHHPIVTKKQLLQYIEGIKEITEEDIVEKSKGDNLSKAWTFVQVGWFSAKYFARVKEHLPMLVLETATFAFALIYGCTWWFWRKKPQDVSEAIRIDLVFPAPGSDQTHHVQVEDDPPKQDSDVVTPVNNIRVKPLDDSLAEKWPPATETFHRHFVAGVGHRLNAIVFGKYQNFDPMASDSVPSFWAIPVGEEPTNLPSVLGCQILCASLFGGVHCCAWNARFPSIIEMWMWRGSAALITGFPPLCFLLLGISNTFDHGSVRRGVFTYTNYGLIALYIVARVALLILPFMTLRSSSPRTFVDADWTAIF